MGQSPVAHTSPSRESVRKRMNEIGSVGNPVKPINNPSDSIRSRTNSGREHKSIDLCINLSRVSPAARDMAGFASRHASRYAEQE